MQCIARLINFIDPKIKGLDVALYVLYALHHVVYSHKQKRLHPFRLFLYCDLSLRPKSCVSVVRIQPNYTRSNIKCFSFNLIYMVPILIFKFWSFMPILQGIPLKTTLVGPIRRNARFLKLVMWAVLRPCLCQQPSKIR